MSELRTCGNCFHWRAECGCTFNPVWVAAPASHHCGQFKPRLPSDDILATEIEMLQVSPSVRFLLKNLGLHTVEDVLIVGRAVIATRGKPGVSAIKELDGAFKRMEVAW